MEFGLSVGERVHRCDAFVVNFVVNLSNRNWA
jgi:hypothetical protein